MFAYLVEHFFAGLWTMIWHFGVGIGLVILSLAGAYFAPTIRMKVILCVAAILIVVFLIGEAIGIRMERAHVDAQAATTNSFIKGTVERTTTPKSRGKADPWDRKEY